MNRINQFKDIADKENIVIIAPCFDIIPNWKVSREKDLNSSDEFINRIIIKEPYLTDFQILINYNNSNRSDLKLLEILEYFFNNLMKKDKIILYGHSGGGQFTSRFIYMYPHLIDKAIISAAGTFLFPSLQKDYPWSLVFTNINANYGSHIDKKTFLLIIARLLKD